MPPKKTAKKSPAKSKRLASSLTFEGQQQRLRTFFDKADYEERQKLWDVLTALRGPDKSSEGRDKRSTTGLIRATFLGKNSLQSDYLTWTREDYDTLSEHRTQLLDSVGIGNNPGSHFVTHAREAFKALGLKWGEANND